MGNAHANLLAVDDNEYNLTLIENYLAEENISITKAKDGDEAWQILQKLPDYFDLVLLDRIMPKMDGMAVLSQIKQHPTLSTLPVIFQTSQDSSKHITEGIAAGAYYYLTKPYDREILTSIVRTTIADSQRIKNLRSLSRKSARSLTLMTRASFSLTTIEDANDLTSTLASCCPNPALAIVGLRELLINAIEHGNLGITYDEKTQLDKEGRWEEEIAHRLSLPEYASRVATIQFRRSEKEISFYIVDQGAGFDWKPYLKMDKSRAFDTHGRGIALAGFSTFDSVKYQGKGNEVIATIFLNKHL
ncbi:MAG TPA: response regulator [Gammaproteobacteria bacterium]|nr:response regulator [Gammaproteobacteria bacterium]